MFTIQTEVFQGPLDKLLYLIQKEKLDINQISLAKVTGNFLEYLNKLEKEKIPESVLANFLIIASKLILIKSKILIPTLELEEEEEEDIQELEIQLKFYQQIKKAEKNVEEKWSNIPQIMTREFLASNKTIFSPGEIKKEDFKSIVESIIKDINKIKPVQKIKKEIVSLKNKINNIMSRITSEPTSLKKFFETGTKNEIAVIFLAVLHLFRNQKIQFIQKERFSEIHIHKK